MTQAIIALLISLLVLATYATVRLYVSIRRLRARYAPIIDVDGELARVKETLVDRKSELQRFLADNERQRTQLDQDFNKEQSTYEGLKRQVSLLEENLEDISFDLYAPHYD